MVAVTVKITASNAQDPYARYWAVYIDRPPTQYPYTDSGHTEIHKSGDTMTFTVDLTPGSHTLYYINTCSPTLGTYSGTISVDSQTKTFSGVNANNSASFTFTVGGAQPTQTGFDLSMLLKPPYVYLLAGGIILALYLATRR